MPTTTTSRHAHAKLNLMLSVGQAFPADLDKPGYHPICGWFSCIDLHDDLEIEPLKTGSSRYDIAWSPDAPSQTPIDWPIDKDLAVRAHKALEAHLKKPLPISLTLRKRIPVAAGLGGGSSDAAACLLALHDAFSLDIDTEALQSIASTLGSDIAFFLDDHDSDAAHPRSAIVSHLGDIIERITDASIDQPIILIIPPFGCSTAAVYKSFDETLEAQLRDYRLDRAVAQQQGEKLGRERSTDPREQMVRGRVERVLRSKAIDTDLLFNDLAKPAFAIEPRLGSLVTNLSNITRSPTHVTGSGSCVFLVPRRGKEDWTMQRVTRVCEAFGAEAAFGGTPKTTLTTLLA